MPGIWLAFNAPIDYENFEILISDQSDSSFSIYPRKNRIFYKSHNFVVGATVPDGYPISLYENQDYIVIVDGVVFGLSEQALKDKLLSICNFLPGANWQKQCIEFNKQVDGEFIILMLNKTLSYFAIFNDSLGRFPFYFVRNNRSLIAGRSINDIAKFLTKASLNKMAMACQILLEYPMDDGTILNEIKSWPAGNLIKYDGNSLSKLQPTVKWNFDITGNKISFNDIAENLSSSLARACEDRISEKNDKKIIVSLSGGYDSRVVAAAFSYMKTNFDAVTRITQLNKNNEVEIAKKIGKILNINHHFISNPVISPEMIINVSLMRDGALSADLAHMLAFLIKVRESIGANVLLFTGDGGDKTLAPLSMAGKINSCESMADYLLEQCQHNEIEIINNITHIKTSDIRVLILKTLNTYPENTIFGKYRGIIFRQRVRRWLSEGEDRNREVFWSTTPFYSPQFFKTAISCPEEWKKNYKLTLSILNILAPACLRIPRAGQIGASAKQRFLVTIYNLIASNKWLLKTYRAGKLARKRKVIVPLAQELNEYLIDILSENSPILGEIGKNKLIQIISLPPTSRFRNRLISLLIALPNIWKSVGQYCK